MKLFDIIFGKAIDRRVAAFQNDLIGKHIIEVENIYRQMRGWRHDYHNHIAVLKAYRSLDENDKVDEYLDSLYADLSSVDTLIKSGNVMIDAILNSKLSLAKSKDIFVKARAIVPHELPISEIDLCIIVGNLLDNAVEACMKINDGNRFIRVYMDTKRESLYLSVTNSSTGAVEQNGKFVSSKGENHGFGLLRVDKIIEKYGGYIKRGNECGAFSSEVMIPFL